MEAEASDTMKLAVVDIDDTLLMGGRLSRLFWHFSLTFQRMGRRLQKVIGRLLDLLPEYDTVVILSGRDKHEIQFTQSQLRKAGIRFDKLICCPRKDLINKWKMSVVDSLDKENRIVWIDDIFEENLLKGALLQLHPNVTTIPPTRTALVKNGRSSELEWL